MHIMKLSYIFILPLIFTSMNLIAEEMIIGEESYGDYQIIFEAAPKDQVYSHPSVDNLKESETDIHIEALITWNDKIDIDGQLPGSHIPYLDVTAHIINLRTKKKDIISLLPHINLSDGFHYARNIKLPGLNNDKYSVKFLIKPDEKLLTYHFDWKQKYGVPMLDEVSYMYSNLDFLKMSKKLRR